MTDPTTDPTTAQVAAPFRATLRAGTALDVLDLSGELDGAAAEALTSAFDASRAPVVLLNFERVGYMNSTGIAIVVELLARAQADGRRIAACNLSAHYLQIFEITRLSDFITIHPNEAAALAASAAS